MTNSIIATVVSIIAVLSMLRILIHMRRNKTMIDVVWLFIWAAIIVIFWSPDIASRVALMVGIGRGADLVTYVAIIIIVFMLYRIFLRMERIERDITVLTREVALHDDSKKNRGGSDTKL